MGFSCPKDLSYPYPYPYPYQLVVEGVKLSLIGSLEICEGNDASRILKDFVGFDICDELKRICHKLLDFCEQK